MKQLPAGLNRPPLIVSDPKPSLIIQLQMRYRNKNLKLKQPPMLCLGVHSALTGLQKMKTWVLPLLMKVMGAQK